jgi:hypothetical protein
MEPLTMQDLDRVMAKTLNFGIAYSAPQIIMSQAMANKRYPIILPVEDIVPAIVAAAESLLEAVRAL